MSNAKSSSTSFTIEKLTASELRRLNKMVLGYGNFKTTAFNAGLHVETLRGILQRGYGAPESIAKIRTSILAETTA